MLNCSWIMQVFLFYCSHSLSNFLAVGVSASGQVLHRWRYVGSLAETPAVIYFAAGGFVGSPVETPAVTSGSPAVTYFAAGGMLARQWKRQR